MACVGVACVGVACVCALPWVVDEPRLSISQF